jgi:hypothetical protein
MAAQPDPCADRPTPIQGDIGPPVLPGLDEPLILDPGEQLPQRLGEILPGKSGRTA